MALTQAQKDRTKGSLALVRKELIDIVNEALTHMDFVVIEGRRTLERQRQLVASGASKTLKSRHLTGHAIDAVPFDDKGQPQWNRCGELAVVMKAAAAKLGIPLEWGGDWKTFKDGPHYQLPRAQFPDKE